MYRKTKLNCQLRLEFFLVRSLILIILPQNKLKKVFFKMHSSREFNFLQIGFMVSILFQIVKALSFHACVLVQKEMNKSFLFCYHIYDMKRGIIKFASQYQNQKYYAYIHKHTKKILRSDQKFCNLKRNI